MGFDGSAPQRATPDATGAPGVLTSRRWRPVGTPEPADVAAVRRALPLARAPSEQLLALLAVRGISDGEELERFFFPTLDHLHDPLLLDEMEAAARRVLRAAAAGESVAVHGDFDVDGLTGTAVLVELLQALTVDGRRCDLQPPFVPDRARDGYGVSSRMIEAWLDAGVGLLVTVDTGSAAHAEIGAAVRGGMEVVVLDHHLFDGRPEGVRALVNPHREGNHYPNVELCGAAVAFKLAQAVAALAPDALPEDFLGSLLDLTALGLIADQMPLCGENRLLVRRGLERIRDREALRPGLRALLEVAGLDHGHPLTASHVAYQIAPRLNACGRVGRVQTALELLLVRDLAAARDLAREADVTNEKRKSTDLLVKEEAEAMARPYAERGDPGLVLGAAGWHRGVIGISASRLVEIFNVPTVLLAIEGETARGSARSVPGVDIKQALDRCSGLLIRHGGHAQAAGMTLHAGDIDAFRDAFLDSLRSGEGGGEVPELYDLTLPLDALQAADIAGLTREIELLEPFGEGNPAPVFRCDGLRLKHLPQTVGRGGEHLRFAFAGPARPLGGGAPALSREFICFGGGRPWIGMLKRLPGGPRAALDREWDILFRIAPNTWRPRNGAAVDPVQQQLIDIKPAEAT